jgi:hypothetical protein
MTPQPNFVEFDSFPMDYYAIFIRLKEQGLCNIPSAVLTIRKILLLC